MAFDVFNNYFVVDVKQAAEHMTDDEFEKFQGLAKKVDILSKNDEEYMVIPKSKCPSLYAMIYEMTMKGIPHDK